MNFRKTTPRLPVADLQRTTEFYTSVLGFEACCTWPEEQPSFCLLERNGVCLAFDTGSPEQRPARPYACGFYIETDVLAVHARIKDRVPVEWGPEVYAYGCREFAVRDPDGYLIIFTEPVNGPPGRAQKAAGAVLTIRPAGPADHEAVWEIFRAVIRTGDAFVFDPDTPRHEALAYWFRAGHHVYVATQDGRIVGSYHFRANQPDLGSHIANASFIVDPSARGLGAGRAMGEHCLTEAARCGFRGMQFNIVASTNEAAIRLWKSLGFETAGTLPGAFRHATLGYVDAYVMFRSLLDLQASAPSVA